MPWKPSSKRNEFAWYSGTRLERYRRLGRKALPYHLPILGSLKTLEQPRKAMDEQLTG